MPAAMSLLDWLRNKPEADAPAPPPATMTWNEPEPEAEAAGFAFQSKRLPWQPKAAPRPPAEPYAPQTIPPFRVEAAAAEPVAFADFAPPPEPAPEEVAPPPLPRTKGVLTLKRGREAEQLAEHIEAVIQQRFRDGVVVIAHEVLADGLDDSRIDVKIDHASFQMLTRSVKRAHVLHTFLVKKLAQARQACYLQYGLPHGPGDLYQRYRLVDAEEGAHAEPLGLVVVEKYDLDRREAQPVPERFFHPVIAETTFFGRNEMEALRTGTLASEMDYVELSEFQGLSVFHLKVRAYGEGEGFFVEYVGNEGNRRAMHVAGRTMRGRIWCDEPVIFGPSADQPYMRLQAFAAYPGERPPEVEQEAAADDAPITAATAAPEVAPTEEPSPSLVADDPDEATDPFEAEKPPSPKQVLAGLRSLRMKAPSEGEVGRTLKLVVPPAPVVAEETPAPEPHHDLHVQVFTKRAEATDYELRHEATHRLVTPRVLVGRQPAERPEQPDLTALRLDFGEALLVENLVVSREHVLLLFDDDGSVHAQECPVTNAAFEQVEEAVVSLSRTAPAPLETDGFTIEGRVESRDIRIVFRLEDLVVRGEAEEAVAEAA